MHSLLKRFVLLTSIPWTALTAEPVELQLSAFRFFDQSEAIETTAAWRVEDGILECSGEPRGYLVLPGGEREDFKLSFQWRWAPGTEGGNSGVLLYVIPTQPGLNQWAQSLEVQLMTEKAGDFWVIGKNVGFQTDLGVLKPFGVPVLRVPRLPEVSEKPLGEWNDIRIVSQGGNVTVEINGAVANHISNVKPQRGLVALQSEGAPIHFRNINLDEPR